MDSPKLQRNFLSTDVYRYTVAAGFALLFTVAILILMIRLIMTSDDDPVVTNTHQKLELHRATLPREEDVMRLFDRLEDLRFTEIAEIEVGDVRQPGLVPGAQGADDSEPDPDQSDQPPEIDLRAKARAIIKDMEDEKHQAWLDTQSGKRKYVSIMQGPMPTAGSSRTSSRQGEAVGSGYRSVYGESEVIVSDNCVMQLRSTAYDYSDFAMKLPATIRCKPPDPKIDLSDLERRVAPPRLSSEEETAE